MNKVLLSLIVLLVVIVPTSSAQWTTISLDQPYRYWHRDPDGMLFDDVVSLDPTNFNNQVLSNPHVQYNDNGEWLVMGYGDQSLGDISIGDAIYVLKRKNSGWYSIPSSPAMNFTAAPPGSNWTSVGGLGSGAAIAKTATATPLGYKYFSLVAVTQAPMVNNNFTRGWMSWAVSTNGEQWQFVAQSGGTTPDPAQSLQLIRRQDLNNLTDDQNGSHLQHVAMVFNKYDNYFYAIVGWAGLGGIKGTSWRIPYDPSSLYGLHNNEVQVLMNNSTFTNTETTYGTTGVSNGLITDYSDTWQVGAQAPKSIAPTNTGPADPMDIVQLYKQDGSFDSMLFFYAPETDMTKIYYVKATSLPSNGTSNFAWSAPQELSLAALFNYPDGTQYSTCGAGGFYMCVNQNGWQADGKPNLFGFVATWRKDKYLPHSNCGGQSQGFLPLHFTLN